MNIRFGLRNEAFKLIMPLNGNFKVWEIDGYGTSMNVSAARGDFAAFQVVIWCDSDFALNVGRSPWISQVTETPVLRLAADGEFETAMNILEMHADDDRRIKADALLTSEVVEYKAGTIVSVWCEVKIPADAKAGTYKLSVGLYLGNFLRGEFKCDCGEVTLEVLDYVMPTPSEQKMHLDLWQHSSNLARKHETPLWSDAHFAVLENYVKTLGDLGQCAVTLVVSEVPWAGQYCCDIKNQKANLCEYSIIPVTKKASGEFVYDYTKMQRYIDLCAKYGIDREISLYGLANVWCSGVFKKVAPDYPDAVKIRYFDEADGCFKYMDKAADIDDYIVSLERYFLVTGQMDRVRLAADEPGDVEAYRKSIGHLNAIAPSFKCKAAINHAEFIGEFGNEVYDFVPYIRCLSKEFDKMCEYKRTMVGKRFMWYVCCGPEYPNTFLGSELTESYFLGVLTSYAGLDGFLRWNYTAFNDDPRADIRYDYIPAGDINFVYPAKNGAPLLTLRYKALKRGIQLYELLERLRDTGDTAALDEAFAFVVRERDIRTYYETHHRLEDMCSVNYADYINMKKFIIEKLIGK